MAFGVRPGQRRFLVGLVALMMAATTGSAVALSAPALVGPQIATPPGPVPVLGPLPADAPAPTSAGVAAAVDRLAAAPDLGRLSGVVLDPASGAVLWDRSSERVLVPGSTGKLVTAAAALLTLDPTERFATRVLPGSDAGTVVLVGGGDPTLTALPPGTDGVYPRPARLTELADKVREAVPGPIKRVLVDTSRYRGATLAPGWTPSDVSGGFITPIQPLMLDGGRADPLLQDGPRISDPALAAGRAMAGLLGADPATVAEGAAPSPDAKSLGSVFSAPVAELVEHAMQTSDNVLAETLAREVSISRNSQPSFTGATEEIVGALNQAGINTAGLMMVDGSGLSPRDRVPARLLGAVLAAAAAPAHGERDTQFLRPILSGLPVAGGDGTLGKRFADGLGRGAVRAKTGTLTDVSSLAGIVTDRDGRLVVFALMSNGTSPALARPRLDAIAAALSGCGCH